MFFIHGLYEDNEEITGLMISHKNTKLPQVLTMGLWPQFPSAIVPDVLKAVLQIMSHEVMLLWEIGLILSPLTFPWMATSGSKLLEHSTSVTQAREHTTIQIPRATISNPGFCRSTHRGLQLYLGTNPCTRNAQALPNVRILAKSSKRIFIVLFV